MRSCLWFGLVLATAAPLTAGDNPTAAFVQMLAKGTATFQITGHESEVPERFRLTSHEFEFETEFERMSGPVRVYKVRFPSPVQTDSEANNTVHGTYFQPEGEGPYPAVVVLHILGGDFPLSQMIANTLARNKVAALFIQMPYYGNRRPAGNPRRMISQNPEETVEGMTQAVLDIRRAAAWLADRPEVDENQLGVTGISLGGIMSALSGAIEPRFQKVAIYLGGGGLVDTIFNNPDPSVIRARDAWLKSGGNVENLKQTIAPVDPITWGHRLKGRQVLMVSASNDEIVPPSAAEALYESMGKTAELVWLDAGHITAARYLYGELHRLSAFFQPSAK